MRQSPTKLPYERAIAAAEPANTPAPQQRIVTEEDLRISRHLDKHGVELFKMSYNEISTEIYGLQRRHENGEKLQEYDIDRLAAMMMRYEQLKGTQQ